MTKAALICNVAALAPRLASRGICANAVAPGFIETAMVAKMPFMTREVGRRLNSLSPGVRSVRVFQSLEELGLQFGGQWRLQRAGW